MLLFLLCSVRSRCRKFPPQSINKPFRFGTNMAIPDYQKLMLPLLKRAVQAEIRVLEAERQMGEEFGLTPEEREQLLPSGKQRVLHNRAHWAKFYMMKA